MHSKTIGILALLAGVGLFSTVEVVTKAVGAAALPFPMVFIRFFTTALILLGLARLIGPGRSQPLTRRDYGWFALNGLIGVALALSLFHLAILIFAKAASCAVVFSANPIFVILFARWVNQEPWTLSKWGALGLGIAGVLCFAWESGAFQGQSLAALGVMALAALFFALSVCISRRVILRYGVFTLMGYTALFGSLMVLPLAVISVGRHGFDGLAAAWFPVLYVALGGTALAYGLYYLGIARTSAFQASMAFFLKPVLASLLAAVFLREHINRFMIMGSLLILSGLVITVASHRLRRG